MIDKKNLVKKFKVSELWFPSLGDETVPYSLLSMLRVHSETPKGINCNLVGKIPTAQ